ncbi:MAG TPA: HAMP domain-containing protein, partial [Planctomycetota bacterium]|nr:HAMP domain-containing protein [Planctomycetota bacterium]
MRVTIRKKMGVMVGILLMIFAAGILSVLALIGRIASKARELAEVTEPASAAAREMKIKALETALGVPTYLQQRDPGKILFVRDAGRTFQELQSKYEALVKNPKARELGTRAKDLHGRMQQVGDELIGVANEQAKAMDEFHQALERLDALLDEKIQVAIKPDAPGAYPKLRAALEMEVNANGIAKGLGGFLKTHQPVYEERIRKDEADFKEHLRIYEATPLSSEEQRWAAEATDLFSQAIALAKALIREEKAILTGLEALLRTREEIEKSLNEGIKILVETEVLGAKSVVDRASRLAEVLTLIFLIASILIGAAAASLMTLDMTRPILSLKATTEAISLGDLSRRVDAHSRDEIGDLATSVNRMTESLSVMVAERTKNEEELRQTNRDLGRQTAELGRKNEEVEAFVYIVSHDLRAPLVNLQGFSQELGASFGRLKDWLRDVPLPDELAPSMREELEKGIPDALRYITASTSRFERLIDALLKLSRSGRQEHHPERLDVGAIVAATLDSVMEPIRRRGANVTVGALPPAWGDRTTVEQVFANLIVNAVNYLDPKRPGEIQIGGEERD